MPLSYSDLKKIHDVLLQNLDAPEITGSGLFEPNSIDNSNVPISQSKILETRSKNVIQAINELLLEIRAVDDSFSKSQDVILNYLGDFLATPSIRTEIEKIDSSVSLAVIKIAEEIWGPGLASVTTQDFEDRIRDLLKLPLPLPAEDGYAVTVFDNGGTPEYVYTQVSDGSTPGTIVRTATGSGTVVFNNVYVNQLRARNGQNLPLLDFGGNGLTVFDGGNAEFSHNLTIQGNLAVNGTTTTVDSQQLTIADPFITINKDATAPGTSGIEIKYGAGATDKENFFWHPVDGWVFSSGDETVATRYKIWSAGNQGTGSGMDADLLDGQEGSWYQDPVNHGYLNGAFISVANVKEALDDLKTSVDKQDANAVWVDPNGSNTNGNGSFLNPYQTIQQAVNQASSGDVIIIKPGQYSGSVIVNKDDLQFDAYGEAGLTSNTIISGKVTLSNVSLAKFSGIEFQNSGDHTMLITGNTNSGSHHFYNCRFTRTDGPTFDAIRFEGVAVGSLSFINGSILGGFDNSSSSVSGAKARFIGVLNKNFRYKANSATSVGLISQSDHIGTVSHSQGTVYLRDIGIVEKDGSNRSIVSTANVSAGNFLSLQNVSLIQEDGTYGILSKTGTCDFSLHNVIRDPATTSFTGTRINLSEVSQDILGNITPSNYTPAGSTLDGHLSGIDTQLGSLSPLDTTLQSIKDLADVGFITRKTDENVEARVMAGTPNRIVITDGDGEAGNPTFDIGTDVVTLTGTQTLTNKTVSGSFTGPLTGNADTATALSVSRNIALGGDATGSANFDGSSDITITTTLSEAGVRSAIGLPVATLPTQDGYVVTVLDNGGSTEYQYIQTTNGSVPGTIVRTGSPSGEVVMNAVYANELRARNGQDIPLRDFGGNGLTVKDGGNVEFGFKGIFAGDIEANGNVTTTSGALNLVGLNNENIEYSASGSGVHNFTGNVVPAANTTYNLGVAGSIWNEVRASTFIGSLNGNATTAGALQTARDITLGGDLTGSASFDGSANITITASVADDSHSHDTRYYTQTAAGNKFLIKDGTGGAQTVSNDTTFSGSFVASEVQVAIGGVKLQNNLEVLEVKAANGTDFSNVTASVLISNVLAGTAPLQVTSSTLVANLNADQLDGQEGSYYTDPTNHGYTNASQVGVTNVKQSLDALVTDVVAGGFVKSDGTTALSANWDAGAFNILASEFRARSGASVKLSESTGLGLTIADITGLGTFSGNVSAVQYTSTATPGTAPLVVASSTLVANLNADQLDGQEGSYYLDLANASGTLALGSGGTGTATFTADEIVVANGAGTALVSSGTQVSDLALASHNHAGVYEPVDATILREADIVDSLVSTSTTDPLSANQGKFLEDNKANKVGSATAGNIATLSASGDLQDSGFDGTYTDHLPGLIGGAISGPSSYTLALEMPVGGTITKIVYRVGTGTLDFNIQINATDVLASDVTVGTTKGSSTSFSTSSFSAGDEIILDISAASADDFSFTIFYTRDLS